MRKNSAAPRVTQSKMKALKFEPTNFTQRKHRVSAPQKNVCCQKLALREKRLFCSIMDWISQSNSSITFYN